VLVRIQTALSLPALQAALKLTDFAHPRLQLFTISVIAGTGYRDGFRWLASQC
jgi:hypothetical protein